MAVRVLERHPIPKHSLMLLQLMAELFPMIGFSAQTLAEFDPFCNRNKIARIIYHMH
jgi:hypothetical protein